MASRGPGRTTSLFAAAADLKRVIAEHGHGPGWQARVREALAASSQAVEARLDALLSGPGLMEQARLEEPGMLPRLRRLQASLEQALTNAWTATAALPRDRLPGAVAQLESLARQMDEAAGQEFVAVHELYEATPAEN
jgi:hypothetical protein